MEKFRSNKYLKCFAFITILLLLVVMVFNWFIDPYGIYNSPRIAGINMLKPQMVTHSTLVKAHSVRHVKPQAIILGTSRAWVGIDPAHGGWSYTPVYNLTFPAASTYEILRYFQHAHYIQPLEQTLFFPDFFMFNVHWEQRSDFDEARLSVSYDGQENSDVNINDTLATLLSLDALYSSKETIMRQTTTQSVVLENGVWEMRYDHRPYRQQFISVYESSFKNWVLPESSPKYQLENPEIGSSPFDYYRQILQIAYRDNIDLRIATSPCHVLLWEVLAVSGLWSEFEQWKHRLVAINEEEAQRAGKAPFPIWDFSIYNEFTTETVPPSGDRETEMQWYWEASHYKKELGDLVLDYIFDYQDDGRPVPDNLGVLMTSENIDEHLLQVRTDREHYRYNHPDEISEVAQQLDLYIQNMVATKE